MTFTDFTPGVNTGFSGELNSNFLPLKIRQIYTGTDFDISGSVTSSSSHILTLATSDIDNATYAVVAVCVAGSVSVTAASDEGRCALQISTAEVGSTTFTDLLEPTSFAAAGRDSQSWQGVGVGYFDLFHTLSAGEKSNGLQVKITGIITRIDPTPTMTLENRQTRLGIWY